MGMLRRRARDERGSVIVEFGLIAPLLLLLVMGVIDFGWMLMKANLVNNATRDAARVASLSGSYTDIEGSLDAELESAGIDSGEFTRSITCTNTSGSPCANSAGSYNANATSGSTVIVTVTYTHNWITPVGALCGLVGGESCTGDTLTLERTSQMVEGVTMAFTFSRKIRRRKRSERGAVAVLFAVLCLVLFGVAALGVDLAQQVNRKHQLINQLDAASTAAAAKLGAENGTITDAVTAAQAFFAANGEGELDPDKIDFWCVVAREAHRRQRAAQPRSGRPTPDPDRPPEWRRVQPGRQGRRGGVAHGRLPGPAPGRWRHPQHDLQRQPVRESRVPSCHCRQRLDRWQLARQQPDPLQHHPGRGRGRRPVRLRTGHRDRRGLNRFPDLRRLCRLVRLGRAQPDGRGGRRRPHAVDDRPAGMHPSGSPCTDNRQDLVAASRACSR